MLTGPFVDELVISLVNVTEPNLADTDIAWLGMVPVMPFSSPSKIKVFM